MSRLFKFVSEPHSDGMPPVNLPALYMLSFLSDGGIIGNVPARAIRFSIRFRARYAWTYTDSEANRTLQLIIAQVERLEVDQLPELRRDCACAPREFVR